MLYDYEFRSRRSNVMARNGMVASSQPLASLAGLDILRSGGTAADAAVTIAAMLNVVEPFSTGIGGDCFALYWDSSSKCVFALNGSGPSAKSSNLDALINAGYEQHPYFTGHAVNVPGTVAAWDALLQRFGRFSLKEVLAPAIQYAFEGYPVTEWIASGWSMMKPHLLRSKADGHLPQHLQYPGPPQLSGNEFLINGRAPRVGERVMLPTLGETLKHISSEGKNFFYKSEFSQQLCKYVQQYGGWLEPSDLAGFEPAWEEPIFADYHGVRLYECPPNGQGLAAIMAAKFADDYDLANVDQVQRTHILIECMRLGFYEALRWVSDPQFQKIPYDQLFSENYVRSRRDLITAQETIQHLDTLTSPTGDDTVYLSVVDGEGNACSFINSLFMGGGTGLVVPGTGVLLQNRAALFSLDPEHPNVLEGGKRPYHTIIPGMITKDGELFSSFGVMGGFMQPQAHLQVLSNMIDLKHLPQQALDMPRFCLNIQEGSGVGSGDPGGEVLLEKGFSFDAYAALRNKGHHVSPISGRDRIVFGGGQIIQRDPQTGILVGGSDPRKDGCALGW